MGKQDGSSRQVTAGPVNDAGTSILHVDMDAFFVSVELLTRPDLRGIPVLVGGAAGRGVVAAASYEARRYGVQSAMPMSEALRRCPTAVVLPGNYAAYSAASAEVATVFDRFTPHVEWLSIDEAFLDVAGAWRVHGSPAVVARAIREQVFAKTGLTCSVGVAATKFVAKVASGRAKPDGMLVIPVAETRAFLHPLPVGALWGVGRVTEQALRRLGIATVGDVAALPPDVLRRTLGSAAAERLRQLADGIDPRVVTAQVRERSIGHERTFSTDVADRAVVHREVLRLADQVARRLRHHALLARTVAVKVRYADFTTLTRSHTLSEPTDVGHRLHAEALALVDPLLADARPVRLVGVRAEQLVGETATPLWLPDAEWSQAERTVDALQARFGSAVVVPASLLASRENPEQLERSGSATPDPAPGRAPPERVYSTRTRESGEPG